MSNRPRRKPTGYQPKLTQASSPASGRLVWIVLGGIVAVAAIAGIVVALSGGGGESGVVEVGFAEIVGDRLPEYNGEPDPAVGTVAPRLRATDTATGDRVSIDPGDGVVHMIGFFAHWCQHCQAELPRIVERVRETALPDGVEMVAISSSVEQTAPNYPPTAWFDREGWPFPVYADSATSAATVGYGWSGYPYWVVVGPDGRVVVRASGEMTDPQFEAMVDAAAAAVE